LREGVLELRLHRQPCNEILVRGQNIFPGYWERPQETAQCLREGWFHTGDQGAVDEAGNWRIVGRVKNLIVLSSGHNVAPDPIEERLRQTLSGAQQVVVVGHKRKHLTAIVTGEVSETDVESAIAALNPTLPHYQRLRGYHVEKEPFSIENGFLTANGKLKRQKVLERLDAVIEGMYSGSAV
jgi:long-chain acyl-CoA synthetase